MEAALKLMWFDQCSVQEACNPLYRVADKRIAEILYEQ